MQAEVVSLVLAAGRSQRMRCEHINKVCCTIGELPAISHALNVYEQCGIARHVVVIGHLGDQVREALNGRHANVLFADQPEPKGTGHATRCGAELLQQQQYQGAILVVAGDKVLQDGVVRELIGTMEESDADVVFLTGEKSANSGSGRVLKDREGRPVAIVEASEISLSRLLSELTELIETGLRPLPAANLLETLRSHFPQERKLQQACPELLNLAIDREQIDVDTLERAVGDLLPKARIAVFRNERNEMIRAHEIEEITTEVNLSVYLFKAPALYEALESLQATNVQCEEYLTDAVGYLSSALDKCGRPRFHLRTVKLEDQNACMGFNTPEELQRIREHYLGCCQDR